MPAGTYRSTADLISLGASLLCTIHCIVLPLLIGTLPLFGIELLENFWLELATVAVSGVAGSWALWRGYRHFHGQQRWLWWFAAGFGLMVAGNFVALEWVEMLLKGMGAVGVAVAHIGNVRRSRHGGC